MNEHSERARLNARFERMRAECGLTDMKFHLGKVSETTTEAVCAEVNRMLDAYESGQAFELVRE